MPKCSMKNVVTFVANWKRKNFVRPTFERNWDQPEVQNAQPAQRIRGSFCPRITIDET